MSSFYDFPGAPAKTDLTALALLVLAARQETAEGLVARERMIPVASNLVGEIGALRDAVDAYLEDLADARAETNAAVARHLAEAGAVHPAVHTSTRVQNWLERHGWQMYVATDIATLWAHPNWPGPRGWSALLPLHEDGVDYTRQVTALVQHVAMVGEVEPEQILLEIAQMPGEVAW